MFGTNTLEFGAAIVLVCALLAAVLVLLARWLIDHGVLVKNQAFVNATYPIIGLVYGTFLAFTIVITWGQFNEAETSATNEVTHLSELWRDAEVFPEAKCREIHNKLYTYANDVVDYDWDSMASSKSPSAKANDSYADIWRSYYQFEPRSETEKIFYSESVSQLNELGRDRRLRVLFASATVQPLVEFFLISGGILIVAFSLLLSCPSLSIQVAVTTLIAVLTSFSIFLVLSLQEPFSGDVSVKTGAFEMIIESFEHRLSQPDSCKMQ